MSAAAASVPGDGQPTLRTKIAAVAVVIALGALAAFAVFSPPTTVKVGGSPAKSAPAAQPAPATGGEPEGEGGEGGD